MNALVERLNQKPILLADGAWGSNLIARGLDPSREPAELWNTTRPEQVETLARAFAGAGADILTANTFGANRVRLERFGLQEALAEINERAIALVGAQAGNGVLVAASVGPTGWRSARLRDEAGVYDTFLEQAGYLTGADLILIETMTDPHEARQAIRAAKAATHCTVVCTYAFRTAHDGTFKTWSGAGVAEALRAALDAGADAVGANCLPPTPPMLGLIATMRELAGTTPLWLKPNAGRPARRGERWNYPYPLSRGNITAPLLEALETGVFGGCCGTTPAAINALRRRIDQLPPRK